MNFKRSLGLLLAACTVITAFAAAQEAKPNRWEKTIAGFEAKDKAAPPPKQPILLTGSSSARIWDVAKHFPGMPVLNRGFGGSTYADLVHFVDRIVVPYAPKALIVYSGDNDVAMGLKATKVFEHFNTFVDLVHAKLPKTPILVIPIKPSTARWKMWKEMKKANALIQTRTQQEDWLTYVDVVAPMLDAEGQPRQDLLIEDGLHMNDQGYKIWTELVMKHLKSISGSVSK